MNRLVSWVRDRWYVLYFMFALGAVVFLAGVAVGRYRLFPYDSIRSANAAFSDWKHNWRHNLGMSPDKLLHQARQDGAGVVAYRAEKAQAGVTFITGFWSDGYGMNLVGLDGSILHQWRVSYNAIWPESPHDETQPQDWDGQIHGALLYPNGDVVFNFRSRGTVRIDQCGNVLWTLPIKTHHSVFEDFEGNLWIPAEVRIAEPTDRLPFLAPPFLEDLLLKVSPEGEVLQRISVLDSIFASRDEGILFANGLDAPSYSDVMDITHLNDIEVLSPALADRFPNLNRGDIMISLRNLDAILILDPVTETIKWSMVGPYLRQHDPDFMPNGRIAVFDNRRDNADGRILHGSRILDIDPVTREVTTYYDGGSGDVFFANIMGEHQRLANGNGLITETERGRAFEVTPQGEVVWTYINRWDEDQVAVIFRATRYPALYADFPRKACS